MVAFIDKPNGAQPVLIDDEGVVITLDPQSCKARKGNLRCILGKIHNVGLKTPHLHRDAEGKLISWRKDNE